MKACLIFLLFAYLQSAAQSNTSSLGTTTISYSEFKSTQNFKSLIPIQIMGGEFLIDYYTVAVVDTAKKEVFEILCSGEKICSQFQELVDGFKGISSTFYIDKIIVASTRPQEVKTKYSPVSFTLIIN